MNRQLRAIFWLILIACAGFVCGILLYSAFSAGKIPENTWIGQLYVGGRTRSEALELLKWLDNSIRERTVVLNAQGRSYRVSSQSLDLRVDMEKARQLVDELINSFDLIAKMLDTFGWTRPDTYNELPLRFNRVNVDLLCDQLAAEIDRPPVNARYDIVRQKFIPETDGLSVDRKRLEAALLTGFQQSSAAPIEVPVVVVEPRLTLGLLENLRISTCISSYLTKFNSDDIPRSLNIRRAAELIDGTILLPNEEFSFNERVGPRTREAGFLEAIEIVDSEYVIGVGGGVCQVSSTLYNAAVLARLAVTQRRPHSRVPSYVPAGRDATVYYPAIDLRFRNTSGSPVMLSAQVEDNVIYVAVLGSGNERKRVEIATKVVATLSPSVDLMPDPSLQAGVEIVDQESEMGLVVETYRRVYESDGRFVSEELLSRDTYPPVNRVVRVGVGL